MEDLFNQLWALLYEHGASEKKKEGTRRFWNTLTEEQQRQVFTTISRKLKEDKFVQFDPIRAIKENTPKIVAKGPTNYRGRKLPAVPVFSAKYNGIWGMYTFDDIKKFNMELPKN